MTLPRVYVSSTSGDQVERALEWLGAERLIRPDSRLFLKPNLTWREHLPGVTTTPGFLKQAVEALRAYTSHISIGESNGGYHSFRAEEAFQDHGLYVLRSQYGVRVVNLSEGPVELRTVSLGDASITVELPAFLLNDVDVFITLPVPKVHAMTRVSLGLKNQWGCQPGTMRLRNHPDFSRKILAINKILRPRLALYDGTYFLDRTGPMVGDPVPMNLVIGSDDVGAGDLACCDVMGIPPARAAHLRLAQQEGMMPASLAETVLNQSLSPFKTHQFRLERSAIQYVALSAFHSHALTRLLYDSSAAGPIHRVLYAIRKNRLIGRLLYGPVGPPQAEGRKS